MLGEIGYHRVSGAGEGVKMRIEGHNGDIQEGDEADGEKNETAKVS